jgi:phospholipid/cholesterol/gamma-HCH transport system permease protein
MGTNTPTSNHDGDALTISREGDALWVRLRGPWTLLTGSRPNPAAVRTEVAQGGALPRVMRFDLAGVTEFDSALVSFLLNCHDICQATKTQFDFDSLPPGPRQLLRLATAVPQAEDVRPRAVHKNLLARIGIKAQTTWNETLEIMQFLGDCTLAVGRFFTGRARFRWSDVWLEIQHCGADALPITTLIAFLMGLILAYVGAVTLRPYGGLIFIANLVGLAMVREMASMMTGVPPARRLRRNWAR